MDMKNKLLLFEFRKKTEPRKYSETQWVFFFVLEEEKEERERENTTKHDWRESRRKKICSVCYEIPKLTLKK